MLCTQTKVFFLSHESQIMHKHMHISEPFPLCKGQNGQTESSRSSCKCLLGLFNNW